MQGVCKDCPDRELYCHSHCEKYKQFVDELIRIKKNRTAYLSSVKPTAKRLKSRGRTLKRFNYHYKGKGTEK